MSVTPKSFTAMHFATTWIYSRQFVLLSASWVSLQEASPTRKHAPDQAVLLPDTCEGHE